MQIKWFFPNDYYDVIKSIKKFKEFIMIIGVIILFITVSLILFPFLNGKILLIAGNYFIVISAVSNKFNILKKDLNPVKLKDKKKRYLFWLKLEKVINFVWILGIILLIITRWISI